MNKPIKNQSIPHCTPSTAHCPLFLDRNLQFAIVCSGLISLFFTSQAHCADAPLAVPIDGRAFNAELKSIDAKGQLLFETAAQKRQMPLGDLVAWGACPELKRAPIFVLADGGCLVADLISSDKETLLADSQLFGRVKLPWDALAGVIFLPAIGNKRSRCTAGSDSPGPRRVRSASAWTTATNWPDSWKISPKTPSSSIPMPER